MQYRVSASDSLSDVTLTMLSWKAWRTVEHTLSTYENAGILELFADRILFFNEITANDRRIADRFGFRAYGAERNVGIFGGIDGLAAATETPYVLHVENDCPVDTDRTGFLAMVSGALEDMRNQGVDVFLMRSRTNPGDTFWREERYRKYFKVKRPLGKAAPPPVSTLEAVTGSVWRFLEDRRRPSLRGCAIYAEADPTARHPGIITRTPNGNWVTSSRFLQWSNCCFLTRADFLSNVVLDHVRNHPAKTTLNGTQDIEAALKAGKWWRRQDHRIGQCEPGPFTHLRIDR